LHHLEINNLCCGYGGNQILKGVTLPADKGEVVSLIGPSGSGKSTLLRALIGLTPPTDGEVFVGGTKVDYSSRASLRRLRDRMSIVFQQYNLFQNMSVLRNVTIAPIKIKKRPSEECEREAIELLRRVGMGVAIARALATKPEILLLDEVTSALDPERVNEVLDTIRNLTSEGNTMIIVSHEMAFVREVSTRVAMMDAGKIVECGSPQQIFGDPREARTREFVSKILKH